MSKRLVDGKDMLTNRSRRHVLNVWDAVILVLLNGLGLVDLDFLSAQSRTERLLGRCLDGQGSRSFCLCVGCLHAQRGAVAWAGRSDKGIGVNVGLLGRLSSLESGLEGIVLVILVAAEGSLGSFVGRSLCLLVEWFGSGGSLVGIRQVFLIGACGEHDGGILVEVHPAVFVG